MALGGSKASNDGDMESDGVGIWVVGGAVAQGLTLDAILWSVKVRATKEVLEMSRSGVVAAGSLRGPTKKWT